MMTAPPTAESLRLVARYHRAEAHRMAVWEKDRALEHINAGAELDRQADLMEATS